ncbi:hypothetical protein ACU4GI_01685 [Cupriavidus basilensis]
MEQRFRKRFLLLGAGHLSDQRSRFFLRILSLPHPQQRTVVALSFWA